MVTQKSADVNIALRYKFVKIASLLVKNGDVLRSRLFFVRPPVIMKKKEKVRNFL